MERLTVDLGSRSYPILIGDGLIRDIGAHVAPLLRRPRTMIVTDSNVAPHYLVGVGASLANDNISFSSLVLPAGEGTKSWEGLARLTEWLIGEGIERSDHVIALGGGVIGDLVGFACSIVKRGCHFIQVPTTLLAQVDSSVGGKTAINVPAGKNLIGAFHQPALVVIDPTTLATLPRRELGAGYAEVVKYGLIDDAAFFDWCEANGAALLAGDAGARPTNARHRTSARCSISATASATRSRPKPAIRTACSMAKLSRQGWCSRINFPQRTACAPSPTPTASATIWPASTCRTASPAPGSTPAAPRSPPIWRMTRRCAAANCR